MGTIKPGATPNWRTEGVRVIPSAALDTNTPQTPGMTRAAAVTHDRAGSEKLWAGIATIHPGAKTGAHHHGELESVIYVIRGQAQMRWGANLEFTAEAGPGGFIFVPPFPAADRNRSWSTSTSTGWPSPNTCPGSIQPSRWSTEHRQTSSYRMLRGGMDVPDRGVAG
ncbi:MAG: hypothetical protein ACRDQJ_01525 [Pseudonocardiaceae bacterium]